MPCRLRMGARRQEHLSELRQAAHVLCDKRCKPTLWVPVLARPFEPRDRAQLVTLATVCRVSLSSGCTVPVAHTRAQSPKGRASRDVTLSLKDLSRMRGVPRACNK